MVPVKNSNTQPHNSKSFIRVHSEYFLDARLRAEHVQIHILTDIIKKLDLEQKIDLSTQCHKEFNILDILYTFPYHVRPAHFGMTVIRSLLVTMFSKDVSGSQQLLFLQKLRKKQLLQAPTSLLTSVLPVSRTGESTVLAGSIAIGGRVNPRRMEAASTGTSYRITRTRVELSPHREETRLRRFPIYLEPLPSLLRPSKE